MFRRTSTRNRGLSDRYLYIPPDFARIYVQEIATMSMSPHIPFTYADTILHILPKVDRTSIPHADARCRTIEKKSERRESGSDRAVAA